MASGLRAPYLHNGSVPTLRDLMKPRRRTPAGFFIAAMMCSTQAKVDLFPTSVDSTTRSAAKIDPKIQRKYFRFDTQLKPDGTTHAIGTKGNSNVGHEGWEYGTMLSAQEKDAIVEYLKTF